MGTWQIASRSFQKAANTIEKHAIHLAIAFGSNQLGSVISALSVLADCLASGCRIQKRRGSPRTYELLAALGCDTC